MVKAYRKLPVDIRAIQFDGGNYKDCESFIGKHNIDNTLSYPNIVTLNGIMMVSVGDFIIEGVNGEFYPCKPDIFNKTYEQL